MLSDADDYLRTCACDCAAEICCVSAQFVSPTHHTTTGRQPSLVARGRGAEDGALSSAQLCHSVRCDPRVAAHTSQLFKHNDNLLYIDFNPRRRSCPSAALLVAV